LGETGFGRRSRLHVNHYTCIEWARRERARGRAFRLTKKLRRRAMARVPDEEIERLKKDVSVERLVEAKGIKLARHGANLVGLCPFHEDREPSLVVTPAKNLWHCLGACQAGGSVIDWVMRAEGVSFRLAVELLRKDAPSVVSPALSPGATDG